MDEKVMLGFLAQIIAKENAIIELLATLAANGDDAKKAEIVQQTGVFYREQLKQLLPEMYKLARNGA